MIVAAAGELQGAVPQLSSCWPLFPGLLKGIKRCFPWKSRISSLDSAAFSSRVKKKIKYVGIKHTVEKNGKKWEAGSALAELEESCPHSQSQLGSVQGGRTWLIFIKKINSFLNRKKNAKLSPACGYAFIKGGPFHLVYILYVHIIKKVFLSLCVFVCVCRFINLIN